MFWAAWNWFCSSKPLQYIGWSYSKVVIPVADFTLRFFPFCFSLWFAEKKKPTNHCWLIGLGYDGWDITSVYSWFHRGSWLHPVSDCLRHGDIAQSSLWRCVRGGSTPFLYSLLWWGRSPQSCGARNAMWFFSWCLPPLPIYEDKGCRCCNAELWISVHQSCRCQAHRLDG